MAKAPAFQFYANDFMDATRLWDANAVGLYVRCMCIQWTQGGVTPDLKLLARAIHCDRSELEACWQYIGPKFEAGEDGLLRNRRLEEVRTRQTEVSSKRSNAANARWDAHAIASKVADAKHVQRKEKVEGEDMKEKKPEIPGSALFEVPKVMKPSKVLFSNCAYSNVEAASKALPELVVEGVDIGHYLDAIRNWSDAKDEKRTNVGWLATFRQWTKTDRDKGTLRKLAVATPWNPRA